ncbi:hypothetical protein YTPLAS18_08680 [Nitrospira sp.]|nr:hypothetical protein YTPLAS18_08680 [Nitrospira sp.]
MVGRRVAAMGFMVLLFSVATVQPASAYVDPGSGSILLQLILGGIAGIGVVAKLYWQRLKHGVSHFLRKP